MKLDIHKLFIQKTRQVRTDKPSFLCYSLISVTHDTLLRTLSHRFCLARDSFMPKFLIICSFGVALLGLGLNIQIAGLCPPVPTELVSVFYLKTGSVQQEQEWSLQCHKNTARFRFLVVTWEILMETEALQPVRQQKSTPVRGPSLIYLPEHECFISRVSIFLSLAAV